MVLLNIEQVKRRTQSWHVRRSYHISHEIIHKKLGESEVYITYPINAGHNGTIFVDIAVKGAFSNTFVPSDLRIYSC